MNRRSTTSHWLSINVVLGCVSLALAGAVDFRALYRAKNDTVPEAADLAGTLLLDRPSPAAIAIEAPNQPEGGTGADENSASAPQPAGLAPTPMPRDLIVADPIIAWVREAM